MSAACLHCNDTGSLSKTLDSYDLDCGHCDAAQQRASLEAWAVKEKLDCSVTALWQIFQHGRAAALANISYQVWQLGDGGWLDVDKDCYDSRRPEDRRRIIDLDDE